MIFGRLPFLGKIVDLVSDESLSIVSLLYAAERGVPLPPLGIIAVREVVSLGMRSVVVDGHQLLATSRLFGGIMAGRTASSALTVCLSRGDNRTRLASQFAEGLSARSTMITSTAPLPRSSLSPSCSVASKIVAPTTSEEPSEESERGAPFSVAPL